MITISGCQEEFNLNKEFKYIHKAIGENIASKLTVSELSSQLKHKSKAIKKYGIKEYNWWNESLHGVARAGVATVFPQAIAMAATFDEDLVYKIASVISNEARAKYNYNQQHKDYGNYKGLTMWSPNINIFRDPRWGRGQETYGEDPYLTGQLGLAFVRGLQGDNPKYVKTAACVKHYAVHSGPEAQRHTIDVRVSKKDMFETYLPAFKKCVEEGDVCGIMGAYNRVNGEACCASQTLIKKIARESWNFDGYFVSDCAALLDLIFKHKITRSPLKAAAMAINSGCDLECGALYSLLPLAYMRKYVSRDTLKAAVARVMEIRSRLGMFDDDCPYNLISPDENATPQNEELAIDTARKAVVMLKNDGTLPLKESENRIFVTGYNAENDLAYLGNYNGEPTSYIKVTDAIKAYNKDTCYLQGTHLYEINNQNDIKNAVETAKNFDVIIMCTGLDPSIEGEEAGGMLAGAGGAIGVQGDRQALDLPKVQQNYLDELVKLNKKIIILNFSGGCIDFRRYKDKTNAILQCWYPGAKGGQAIADIIFGKVSPSGKLPITFYNSIEDLPQFENYSMENRTYRYFSGEAQYPFGYGLTYTNFKITRFSFIKNSVAVTVLNDGLFDCDEVLQLYVSYPEANVKLPIKSLVKAKRIHIKAGKSAELILPLCERDLYTVDKDGNTVFLNGTYSFTLSDGENIEVSPIEYINKDETKVIEKCPI